MNWKRKLANFWWRRRMKSQQITAQRINFGCGSQRLPGYLNVDRYGAPGVYPHHVPCPFPCPDSSISAIFSEHMIEHLGLDEARAFLRDCWRLLLPGRPIRIATPDLARFVGFYRGEQAEDWQRYAEAWCRRRNLPPQGAAPIVALNEICSGHGHRFVFDEAFLTRTMEECGFIRVRRCRPGESDLDCFRGIEGHGRVIGETMNELETLVVEAWKPVKS